MKRVVVLAGEGEYESQRTMRPVVAALAERFDLNVDYRTPDVIEDVPDFPLSSFGDLSGLADAELLIMYTRFRVLPDDEIAAIASYLEAGGNIVALRTSNHAFHPVEGSTWFDFTSGFASRILGSAWSRHHGHTSTTDVSVVGDHPVVSGLPRRFHVESWLYVTDPPADATVLLWGVPIDPEGDAAPSAVAWARQLGDQHIVYTSLGSQSDLQQPEVLTFITNAVGWCL